MVDESVARSHGYPGPQRVTDTNKIKTLNKTNTRLELREWMNQSINHGVSGGSASRKFLGRLVPPPPPCERELSCPRTRDGMGDLGGRPEPRAGLAVIGGPAGRAAVREWHWHRRPLDRLVGAVAGRQRGAGGRAGCWCCSSGGVDRGMNRCVADAGDDDGHEGSIERARDAGERSSRHIPRTLCVAAGCSFAGTARVGGCFSRLYDGRAGTASKASQRVRGNPPGGGWWCGGFMLRGVESPRQSISHPSASLGITTWYTQGVLASRRGLHWRETGTKTETKTARGRGG